MEARGGGAVSYERGTPVSSPGDAIIGIVSASQPKAAALGGGVRRRLSRGVHGPTLTLHHSRPENIQDSSRLTVQGDLAHVKQRLLRTLQ